MAKYDVTYICGHTDTIQLIGPMRDRQWRLAREKEKLCPDCYRAKLEADRQKQNAEAAEANQAAGLPALEGTEKQIAWAETIRKQIIDAVQKEIFDRIPEDNKIQYPEIYDKLVKSFNALKSHSAASWWIDNRDISLNIYSLKNLLDKEYEALQKAEAEPPKQIIEEAQVEATVYPEKAVTSLVAEISIKGDTIEVQYPERNETFRQIMRGHGFEWKSGWVRKIGKFNGDISDRVAEIGNKLLAAGFPVRIYDKEIRRRAVVGKYAPEPKRWIKRRTTGKYAGWLEISWPYEGSNYYDAARKLPGSQYSRPNVVVPPESFQEVLDFAQMYKFNISNGAQEAIETARQLREKALTTGVKVPKSEKPPKPGEKPEKLEIPEEVTIDEEFRDEN